MTQRNPNPTIAAIEPPAPDVYRANAPESAAACALCGQDAQLRCPRCGCPLCSSHAVDTQHRCERCEATFSARRRRLDTAALSLIGLGLAGWVGYVLINLDTDKQLAAFFFPSVIVAAMLVGWGAAVGLMRRRFLAQGDGEIFLDGVEPRIAAVAAQYARPRSRGVAAACNRRRTDALRVGQLGIGGAPSRQGGARHLHREPTSGGAPRPGGD